MRAAHSLHTMQGTDWIGRQSYAAYTPMAGRWGPSTGSLAWVSSSVRQRQPTIQAGEQSLHALLFLLGIAFPPITSSVWARAGSCFRKGHNFMQMRRLSLPPLWKSTSNLSNSRSTKVATHNSPVQNYLHTHVRHSKISGGPIQKGAKGLSFGDRLESEHQGGGPCFKIPVMAHRLRIKPWHSTPVEWLSLKPRCTAMIS